jgi:phage baseplate assembly protein gpV
MKALAEALARIAELERKVAGGARSGFVHEVDAAAGTVRLKFGDGPDGPFLSPPIPYAQTMGALKAHIPPSVGQSMTMMAPGGDWRQAVAIGLSASDSNPSPSGDGAQNVITFGAATITLTGSGLTIQVGGSSIQITAGEITLNAPIINLN